MTANEYLRHCMIISLKRRSAWVALAAGLALLLGLLLNLKVGWLVVESLLVAAVVAAWIALNSWSRHSLDPEAQAR